MRIAVWNNVPSGGAKRSLSEHVDGLVHRGHEVEIWCPPGADRSFLPVGEQVVTHVVPVAGGPPPWWAAGRVGALRSPRALIAAHTAHARECAEQIRADRFDVCLAATCQVFGAPPIGRFLSGPNLLYLQEPHRWLYEANPAFPWLAATTPSRVPLEAARIHRRSQRARFEVDNAHAFDRVLVNSRFSRETLLRVYGLDSTVCYLGVDTDAFRPSGAVREDLVVGVGAVSTHKNPLLLVHAVGLLAPPRPRVEWVGASVDEAYSGQVEAAARSGGVDLTIHRNVGDDVLVAVLGRARALVYTPRLEPFGLVPLEAGACELPVVAVAEGGIRETVLDGVTGLLVEPTPESVARAIDRLRADPELAARLGRAGREAVERRWTADAALDRLEAEISGVVDARRR